MRFLFAAAALLVVLAACSGTAQREAGSSSSPSTSPAPSVSAVASGTVAQNLVLTGPAAGTLTNATTKCNYFSASTQLNILLTGKLNGQDLTFNIQINSGYTGPGDYPVGGILDDNVANLRLQVGSYEGSSATGGGTLVINPDGKSGALKANLSGDEHVQGDFACNEVVQS